jgi:hypothetical protein
VDKEIHDYHRIWKVLSATTLQNFKVGCLAKLKKDSPIILCKIEKIFPAAFFDVMVHLPEEGILRGPVHYGWMHPVERSLCTLKRSVRNQTSPEGSIAKAYVANEALTFCSRYFAAGDVAT